MPSQSNTDKQATWLTVVEAAEPTSHDGKTCGLRILLFCSYPRGWGLLPMFLTRLGWATDAYECETCMLIQIPTNYKHDMLETSPSTGSQQLLTLFPVCPLSCSCVGQYR